VEKRVHCEEDLFGDNAEYMKDWVSPISFLVEKGQGADRPIRYEGRAEK
jgi:hypothetical protein